MKAVRKRSSSNPARIISESFVAVIAIGTLLLWLPISSRDGQFTPLLDSLFTATSATCVTGLVLYDTWTHWNPLGQGVLLMLIQIGGLGPVSYTHLDVYKRQGFGNLHIVFFQVSIPPFLWK